MDQELELELEAFRQWVVEQRQQKTAKAVRYPEEKRQWATQYARRRLQAGVPMVRVQQELMVSEPALQRWLGTKSGAKKTTRSVFRAVVVKRESGRTEANAEAGITLITPRGYRLQGLDSHSAVALVRELG